MKKFFKSPQHSKRGQSPPLGPGAIEAQETIAAALAAVNFSSNDVKHTLPSTVTLTPKSMPTSPLLALRSEARPGAAKAIATQTTPIAQAGPAARSAAANSSAASAAARRAVELAAQPHYQPPPQQTYQSPQQQQQQHPLYKPPSPQQTYQSPHQQHQHPLYKPPSPQQTYQSPQQPQQPLLQPPLPQRRNEQHHMMTAAAQALRSSAARLLEKAVAVATAASTPIIGAGNCTGDRRREPSSLSTVASYRRPASSRSTLDSRRRSMSTPISRGNTGPSTPSSNDSAHSRFSVGGVEERRRHQRVERNAVAASAKRKSSFVASFIELNMTLDFVSWSSSSSSTGAANLFKISSSSDPAEYKKNEHVNDNDNDDDDGYDDNDDSWHDQFPTRIEQAAATAKKIGAGSSAKTAQAMLAATRTSTPDLRAADRMLSVANDNRALLRIRTAFHNRYMNPLVADRFMTIGDFALLCTLGRGGFGRVLVGLHRTTRTYYAVKVCAKENVRHHKQKRDLLNERTIMYACRHPNISRMYACFKDTTHLYFVSDLCVHGDLFKLLDKSRRFGERQTLFYAANIFAAIQYLHANQIVYRDLKPENVLVKSNGYLLLTDFGFAKRISHVGTRTRCGTPDYMSPEMLNGKSYGPSVDWWSFGVMVFEMLTGHPPFMVENRGDVTILYREICGGNYCMPDWFSKPLEDALRRLLVRDPRQRLGCVCDDASADDLRAHEWFAPINWALMHTQVLRAPFVPEEISPGELSRRRHSKTCNGAAVEKLVVNKEPVHMYEYLFKDF